MKPLKCTVHPGMRLCNFKEVCPNGGPNQNPTGGAQNFADMWSPIVSATGGKEFVQTGPSFPRPYLALCI